MSEQAVLGIIVFFVFVLVVWLVIKNGKSGATSSTIPTKGGRVSRGKSKQVHK
jgi:preprotein translocase subunit SecG